MVDKDTLSYKKGFARGIEIYTQNMSNGYYADDDNRRCVSAFNHYAETGYKKGIRLNEGQRQYFYGMADGIQYKYKQMGTTLVTYKKESLFERHENEHYYGKKEYNADDDIFG